MPFEVEQKFPVTGDPQPLLQRISDLGGIRTETLFQQDLYFNHPVRDFAVTDEALRIRTIDQRNFVTFKGPKLDPRVKTRQEIEIPLGDGLQTADDFGKMLLQLGFRAVHPVRKQRTIWKLHWQNRDWELAWDEVEGLGTFLEIETITSEQSELSTLQDLLLSLAARLNLQDSERKSYLEMTLEKISKT
jgi:adenylate cyclase class 2